VRISPPTAPSGTALPSRAANEAYRNAQKRFNQQPSPPIDDFINTIGPNAKCRPGLETSDASHLELKFITSLWTKSADQILASVKRFCQKTQQTLCGEL
jgi:hypothetical protein